MNEGKKPLSVYPWMLEKSRIMSVSESKGLVTVRIKLATPLTLKPYGEIREMVISMPKQDYAYFLQNFVKPKESKQ